MSGVEMLFGVELNILDADGTIDVYKRQLLRVAACMEEHFPHSMAKAVVYAAKKRNLEHEEMHSKVEYMVAHGISTERCV